MKKVTGCQQVTHASCCNVVGFIATASSVARELTKARAHDIPDGAGRSCR
jgi:hypothetical protein